MPVSGRSGVIPLPNEIVLQPGSFRVDATTTLHVPPGDRDADNAARYLVELWTRTNGLTLPVSPSAAGISTSVAGSSTSAAGIGTLPADTIVFHHQPGFGPEAYGLEITPQQVTVSASSAAGLFYGAVTLWQLTTSGEVSGTVTVHANAGVATFDNLTVLEILGN